MIHTVTVKQRGQTKFLCLIGDRYNVKFSLSYSSITYIDSMKTLIFRLANFNYVLSLGFRSDSTKLYDIYQLCTN